MLSNLGVLIGLRTTTEFVSCYAILNNADLMITAEFVSCYAILNNVADLLILLHVICTIDCTIIISRPIKLNQIRPSNAFFCYLFSDLVTLFY